MRLWPVRGLMINTLKFGFLNKQAHNRSLKWVLFITEQRPFSKPVFLDSNNYGVRDPAEQGIV